jgi:hypothetical protein
VHDLRATFVTLALAVGRSEAWVADRIGHRSSVMINRYRRAARTAQELGLGELLPLAEALGLDPQVGQKVGQSVAQEIPLNDESSQNQLGPGTESNCRHVDFQSRLRAA